MFSAILFYMTNILIFSVVHIWPSLSSNTCSFHCLRPKIKGAVEYCKAKRLTKSCLYEKKTKYLVLISDKVEQLGGIDETGKRFFHVLVCADHLAIAGFVDTVA